MKFTRTLLETALAGVVVAIVFFGRHRGEPPTDSAVAQPALAASGGSKETVPERGANLHPPSASRRGAVVLSPGRADETVASVHRGLELLRESETGDEEAVAELMAGLSALLTDRNAAGIVRSLSTEELGTSFGLVALGRWLDHDTLAAANWIALRSGATEEQAWLVACKLLDDPARLDGYCDELPDGAWKQNVLNGAGLAVLAQNPNEAIALAQRMNPGPARQNLLETVAYDWTGREPRAALGWIVNVPDPTLRERLLAVGAKAIAANDPDLAVTWLNAAVNSPGILNDTALVLAETWADRNPAAAAQWVARLPESEAREPAVDLVSRRWLQVDPGAATAWIQTLPERDRVLAALAAPPPESPADPE